MDRSMATQKHSKKSMLRWAGGASRESLRGSGEFESTTSAELLRASRRGLGDLDTCLLPVGVKPTFRSTSQMSMTALMATP